MKTMLRFFLMLLLLGAAQARAQTGITITYYDSSQQQFEIAQDGKLYFNGNNLEVKTAASAALTTIPVSIIQKITYSENTAGVGEVSVQNGIVLYPNPTSHAITLANAPDNVTDISIYSMAGQLVSHTKYTDGEAIDVSGLSSGIYIVKAGATTLKFSKI